jgi:hypothetical protein
VLAGEDQRPAADQALQFAESDDRAREGDGTNSHADRHLNQTATVDRAAHPDPVGFGKGEGGGRHADRSETDEAMKRRDQLRQRRHLNTQRDISANRAADQNSDDDQPKAHHMRGRQRRDHRDDHAGDAVYVPRARCFRRGEAA